MKILFFVLIFKCDSLDVLKFALFLENEKDYYRAISEYKRALFLLNLNEKKKDSILIKIADLNLRLKLFDECFKTLKMVKDTLNRDYSLIKYFLFLKKGEFEKARKITKFSDTLYAYTFLKEKRFKDFEKVLNIKLKKISYPNPYLASFFSALIPGSGKIYIGRFYDGFTSFIINAFSFYLFYHNYSKNKKSFGTYFSGFLFSAFYISNIYGSYVQSIYERKIREDELIFQIELDFLIFKRFSEWLY